MRQLILPVTRARRVDISLRSSGRPSAATSADPVQEWTRSVSTAASPVLLTDADCAIIAISRSAAELLGTKVTRAMGRGLLDLITLVDFHSGVSTMEYAVRIPPTLAAREGMISRGLFRISTDRGPVTIDAVAAPVYDEEHELAGAICFMADLAGSAS